MHRILTSLLVLAFAGLLFTPAATAQTPHHKLRRIRGEITAVDTNAQTFDLNTPGGHTVTVRVGQKTRIVVDGQPAKLEDLEVGMRAIAVGHPDPKNKVFRARGVKAKSPPAP